MNLPEWVKIVPDKYLKKIILGFINQAKFAYIAAKNNLYTDLGVWVQNRTRGCI